MLTLIKFDARPSGFVCPNAAKVKSYCDSQDPYCCNGNDANHHQQYVSIYGSQALTFVNSKLGTSSGGDGGGGGGTDPGTGGGGGGGTCAALWAQCGGQGWAGATCCTQGTCKAASNYYSQCLN